MAGNLRTLGTEKIEFIIDSGASHHIINDDSVFEDFINLETPIQIQTAKRGVYILATKEGTIRLTSNTGIPGILEGVLYCAMP